MNSHLSTIKLLINAPGSPGSSLIDIKNRAGRTALGEAEMAGWDEGAVWLVGAMELPTGQAQGTDVSQGPDSEDVGEMAEGDEVVEAKDIEIEIEDADGGIAKMSLTSGNVVANDSTTAGATDRGG
jgi:uncharacterized protein